MCRTSWKKQSDPVCQRKLNALENCKIISLKWFATIILIQFSLIQSRNLFPYSCYPWWYSSSVEDRSEQLCVGVFKIIRSLMVTYSSFLLKRLTFFALFTGFFWSFFHLFFWKLPTNVLTKPLSWNFISKSFFNYREASHVRYFQQFLLHIMQVTSKWEKIHTVTTGGLFGFFPTFKQYSVSYLTLKILTRLHMFPKGTVSKVTI